MSQEHQLNWRPLAGQRLQRERTPEAAAEGTLRNLVAGASACELARPPNASRTVSSALAAEGRTARGRTACVLPAKRHTRQFDFSRLLASAHIRFS